MRNFTAVVERDPETGLFVGYIPGWAGAHSQGATLDELRENLREVVSMLIEDGDPYFEAEFIGTQSIAVRTDAASSRTQCGFLSNNFRPSSSSRSLACWLNAGCETGSRWAARRRLSSSATATK